LAQGKDIQLIELDELLAAIFNHAGGPVSLGDVVSVIADIKGIRDLPPLSFDSDEDDLAQNFSSDSRIRIDTVLEMLEPLTLIWEGLCQLPRDEFKVYILYARDKGGEDLVTLFLAAKVVTASQVADQLDLSMDQFQDLWLKRLPLDNESIAFISFLPEQILSFGWSHISPLCVSSYFLVEFCCFYR
jgi:hypothetical protein